MNIINKIKKIFQKEGSYTFNPKEFYNKKTNTIKVTDKTIYKYLKSCAGNNPNYYALNYFDTRITYREMYENIELISRSLKYLGVKEKDIVTICMPNTPEVVYAFYACNNIGAVADMVHPLSSPNEVKNILNTSGSRILILYDYNYTRYKDIIEETSVYKTILVSPSESMNNVLTIGYMLLKGRKIKKPSSNDKDYMNYKEFKSLGHYYNKKIENHMKSNDLAVLLHSGGTTGISKGIMVSNYNFNAEVQQGMIVVEKVKPKDKIMTVLPNFHGFGLAIGIDIPLCLGVEVILIPEFEAKRFSKIIKEYKPQVLVGVPTLWEALMTNFCFTNSDFSSFKYIISGGDHLSIAQEKKFNKFLKSKGAEVKVTKGYGMTECVAASAYTFDNVNEVGSVGIPMVGNKICICKTGTCEEASKGEEGEICITGPTVMMGYYKNEAETNNVFKFHSDNLRWLHTGDIGYITDKGILYFTQRIKRIIISSGFNVYPSSIEEVINSHPKVKTSCVIGIPHPYKISVPKAYVVLNNKEDANLKLKAEISLLCKKNLAVYSWPKEIEFIDELPKTLYSKIDYKKLEEESKRGSKND